MLVTLDFRAVTNVLTKISVAAERAVASMHNGPRDSTCLSRLLGNYYAALVLIVDARLDA